MTHSPRIMLVTGGAGFIGCNFLRTALEGDPELRLVNLDALTYAGHSASQDSVASRFGDRYTFVEGDIRDADLVRRLFDDHDVDTVVHFAAESHVDRSIDGPLDFIDTNIRGTANLLEAARSRWQGRDDVRFHHISTDEVFGSLGTDGSSPRTRPTTHRAPTPHPRLRRITWSAPGSEPMACPSRSPTAPTTTAPTSSRRSSSR